MIDINSQIEKHISHISDRLEYLIRQKISSEFMIFDFHIFDSPNFIDEQMTHSTINIPDSNLFLKSPPLEQIFNF